MSLPPGTPRGPVVLRQTRRRGAVVRRQVRQVRRARQPRPQADGPRQHRCSATTTRPSNPLHARRRSPTRAASSRLRPQPGRSPLRKIPVVTAGFRTGSTCTLQPSQSGPTAYCTVTYVGGFPQPPGTQPPITGTFSGDSTFASSSGRPMNMFAAPPETTTTTTATTTRRPRLPSRPQVSSRRPQPNRPRRVRTRTA